MNSCVNCGAPNKGKVNCEYCGTVMDVNSVADAFLPYRNSNGDYCGNVKFDEQIEITCIGDAIRRYIHPAKIWEQVCSD